MKHLRSGETPQSAYFGGFVIFCLLPIVSFAQPLTPAPPRNLRFSDVPPTSITPAPSPTPSGGLPLVPQSDLSYLGAFKIPNTGGEHRVGYGGGALGYNPVNKSLFIGCHIQKSGDLAEVSIVTPSKISGYNNLPSATILKSCTDVTEGTLGTINPSDPNQKLLGGSLVYNNRLISSAYAYYDGSCTQKLSHGVSLSLDLSVKNNFSGFFKIDAEAVPRAMAGYMTVIPAALRSQFGGPALTGFGGGAIIGCASSGPAVTVFNPDDVGVRNPIPGKTLLTYPDPEGPVSGELFHWLNSTSVRGIAFPEGRATVLFIGTQGDTRCYGVGTADSSLNGKQVPGEPAGVSYCFDPCQSSKGVHSYKYHTKVWAYKADDLLSVKAGKTKPADVRPYGSWTLPEFGDCSAVTSATYDPVSSTIYIAPDFGESPIVHVYRVNVN